MNDVLDRRIEFVFPQEGEPLFKQVDQHIVRTDIEPVAENDAIRTLLQSYDLRIRHFTNGTILDEDFDGYMVVEVITDFLKSDYAGPWSFIHHHQVPARTVHGPSRFGSFGFSISCM
jgi:hypothetical protein